MPLYKLQSVNTIPIFRIGESLKLTRTNKKSPKVT